MAFVGRRNKKTDTIRMDAAALARAADAALFAVEIETVRAVERRYAPGEAIRFGAGTRCPACGRTGFVVSINVNTGSCENSCLTCKTDWWITVRALDAVAEQAAEVYRQRQASWPELG